MAAPASLRARPFTVAEAAAAGVGRDELRSASWRRLRHGMYAWSGLPDTTLLRLHAIQRTLPLSAAFSDQTAAWLHGLDLEPDQPVCVIVPPEAGVSGRAGISIRRADLPAADVTQRHHFAVTTPLRTATDLGRRLPFVDAVIALDMALHAGMVTSDELGAFVGERRGLHGTARLRKAVAFADGRSESPMETRLRLTLTTARLPAPEPQVALHDDCGRFIARRARPKRTCRQGGHVTRA